MKGKYECTECGRRHSNGWHCAKTVLRLTRERDEARAAFEKSDKICARLYHNRDTLQARVAELEADVARLSDWDTHPLGVDLRHARDHVAELLAKLTGMERPC